MAKKSDTHAYLASPASAAGNVGSQCRPSVAGAILQKAETAGTEPSPAAAEPLPANVWPRVDEYLDEPDEVHRWERIGDERKEAMPATPDHGDPHFELDALVKVHLAKGYTGSADLKTRVSKKHEYASDTCVRRKGIDPATGIRYLEELVFEVVHKRSAKETKARAKGFATRGVRRQIGVFVKGKKVCEWLRSKNDWGQPMDLGGSLRDPCLAVPLPLAALFSPALADLAIARALEAKDNPVILEIKEKSEKRGEERGEKRGEKRGEERGEKRGEERGEKRGEERGEKRGLAESILMVLSTRGFVTSKQLRERILATTDRETLERWLRRAVSAASLDEVLDEG